MLVLEDGLQRRLTERRCSAGLAASSSFGCTGSRPGKAPINGMLDTFQSSNSNSCSN